MPTCAHCGFMLRHTDESCPACKKPAPDRPQGTYHIPKSMPGGRNLRTTGSTSTKKEKAHAETE